MHRYTKCNGYILWFSGLLHPIVW